MNIRSLITLLCISLTISQSITAGSKQLTLKNGTTVTVPTGKPVELADIKGGSPVEVLNALVSAKYDVVVDFHAKWCGPCRQMGETLSDVAPTYDNIIFLKVDTENKAYSSVTQGISAIPTLKYYQGGALVKTDKGAKSKTSLKDLLNGIYQSAKPK